MTTNSPGAMLDRMRSGGTMSDADEDAMFDRLIGGFDPDDLARAVAPRLANLGGSEARMLLRLVEGLARGDLYDALAAGLGAQPDLGPEVAMEAFSVLEGTGRIEASPGLLERRDELEDFLNVGDPIGELLSELEEDPESIAAAVEALSRIEPQIRADILADLEDHRSTPAVALFFERWAEIAISSPPAVVRGLAVPTGPGPALLDCRIAPPDGQGRGVIELLARADGEARLVRFQGHVLRGLIGFDSRTVPEGTSAAISAEQSILAAVVLIESLAQLGVEPDADGAERWLESITGRPFRSTPLAEWRAGEDLAPDVADLPLGEASEAVLEACPGWRLRSSLANGLARELLLRDGPGRPDPTRDPGPFRMLFEAIGPVQIEQYRRMLIWAMTAWASAGRDDLVRSALRIIADLNDPQNAVPGHPFLSTLMARSLEDAMTDRGDRE